MSETEFIFIKYKVNYKKIALYFRYIQQKKSKKETTPDKRNMNSIYSIMSPNPPLIVVLLD